MNCHSSNPFTLQTIYTAINSSMKNISCILICSTIVFALSCKSSNHQFDATGLFEAEEVVVSSELSGKLIRFDVEEGASLSKDSIIGQVDPMQYELQKEQIEASISAVNNKNIPVTPQLQILEAQSRAQNEQMNTIQVQLTTARTEKSRIEKLVHGEAAPAKQLEDMNAQIDLLNQQIKSVKSQIEVTQQQIRSQKQLIAAQNAGINSEKEPLAKRKEQAADVLSKTNIKNPISGVVLARYVHQYEVVTPAKPLYKIANIDQLKLRAYVSGDQLSKLALNQEVSVFTDFGEKGQRNYKGKLVWISDKAEFTPKTIQTKEERANLVYAVKIQVPNDGYLKIGMYGEVKF